MDSQAINKNPRIQVVHKPRYVVLIPPLAWIVLSIWAMGEIMFPRFIIDEGTRNPPSNLFGAVYFGLMAVWILWDMAVKKKRNLSISIEQKSFLPFVLGVFLSGVGQYLHFNKYLFALALILTDILPVVTIVVLLQGKSFGILHLYHRDVQIIK